MTWQKSIVSGLLPALLAGCVPYYAASYIADGGISATLEVGRPLPWRGWQASLVFQHGSLCQRRFPIDASGVATPKVDVFMTAPNLVSLNLNQHWYVADLNNCWLQAYRIAPPRPGPHIGTFHEVAGTYVFTPGDQR